MAGISTHFHIWQCALDPENNHIWKVCFWTLKTVSKPWESVSTKAGSRELSKATFLIRKYWQNTVKSNGNKPPGLTNYNIGFEPESPDDVKVLDQYFTLPGLFHMD
ncbi:uncharacterized protein LACBIDRAFT_331892 [Laccaria bicolor S238N-H82]|uniref:Predicted protein n=1 Tax=Laccaria bicolor (strain S238N-H82 / ATCC MYA-4686) TaxID=486041 RepID=B0DQY4_LACBS|nr:uncharacterized protein LACBIDRAFT_331892 [Laccaria bicolor S238N-H82]EDR02968.1 predicted protein [Laccaria bicolor S238N-H82]|eukprot:XP_001886391.1 predicted protein [Laccaria bicolor S238N-H82]